MNISSKIEKPRIKDAINLVQTIVEDFSDEQEWLVINLAKRDQGNNKLSGNKYLFQEPYQDVPPAYLFDDYDTIKYLVSLRLLHWTVYDQGWSYGKLRSLPIGFKSNDFTERHLHSYDSFADPITKSLQHLNYCDAHHRVAVFCLVNQQNKDIDTGPKLNGQHYALVFKKELVNFLQYFESNRPSVIDENFYFLGKKIAFEGEIERKSLQLLVSKINHIVTKEEFYEVRGLDNYQKSIKSKGKTSVHDPLKKIFEQLKTKITKDPILDEALVFVNRNGYGIFVNETASQFHNEISELKPLDSNSEYLEDLEEQYYRFQK